MVGTKFDKTKQFINKYENESIIWYFDIDYMNSETLLRNLWHLRDAGWFKNTDLIILGRVEEESVEGISLDEAITRGLRDTNIKYISNFDLGHTYLRLTIINGSKVDVICNDKERLIEILKDE